MTFLKLLGSAFNIAILFFKSWFQSNNAAKKNQKKAISKAIKAHKKKDLRSVAEAIDEYNAQ